MNKTILILALAVFASACAPASGGITVADEKPAETPENPQAPRPHPNQPGETSETRLLILSEASTIRSLANGVLETAANLPAGTQVAIPLNPEPDQFVYRAPNGSLERSSTGFFGGVSILSVPPESKSKFPDDVVAQLNSLEGGLYLSASLLADLEGTVGYYAAIEAAPAGEGYMKYFTTAGKPKFSYTTSLTKRFPKINQGVKPENLSAANRAKYQAIYNQLVRVGDRTQPSQKSLLLIDQTTADARSKAYESNGAVPLNGAWTIAVRSTAVRHGFPNVPCAEFMSQVLREAYQRAGYRQNDDFNTAKGNRLIWSSTAAVVNLSKALYDAGWIAWDTTKYRPMTGAIMMHAGANTPGHAYMAAGDDGKLIVDNGSPQGRDLRKTVENTVKIMYQTGVFFLPPGINPTAW